jgi:hypothetical protein
MKQRRKRRKKTFEMFSIFPGFSLWRRKIVDHGMPGGV